MPQFPILHEGTHSAEFILSEANYHRSRGNAFLADPVVVRVGQPLTKTAEATTDRFATYVPATSGANCHALAIYAAVSQSGDDVNIAVIERDAEVNGKLLSWGTLTPAEQVIGAATLLGRGIVVR